MGWTRRCCTIALLQRLPFVQAFLDAIVAFCADSQLLSVADAAQMQQQQAHQAAVADQRRRCTGTGGAACSQAAALLSEPKVCKSATHAGIPMQQKRQDSTITTVSPRRAPPVMRTCASRCKASLPRS